MKAILLSAGFGKRLRPLTNKIPKCLVKINKIPILEIWIKKLEKLKVSSLLINIHYKKDLVKKFLKNNFFKIKILTIYEKKLLGTGGTLINNLDFYDNKDGFLIHTDNYCEDDLKKLVKAHYKRPKNCLITCLAFKTEETKNCGIFFINKKNIAIDFIEKQNKKVDSNLANAAIYILSKELITNYKKVFFKSKDFSKDILKKLVGKIYVVETKKKMIDIGTWKNYNKVNNAFNHKKF